MYPSSYDPRGPLRRITAIQESAGPTLITKECGHTSEHANHFTYKVGADIHCFDCRKPYVAEEHQLSA